MGKATEIKKSIQNMKRYSVTITEHPTSRFTLVENDSDLAAHRNDSTFTVCYMATQLIPSETITNTYIYGIHGNLPCRTGGYYGISYGSTNGGATTSYSVNNPVNINGNENLAFYCDENGTLTLKLTSARTLALTTYNIVVFW